MKIVKEFIGKYYTDAKKAERAVGVPHLLILAQAALESEWGKNAPGNNFFQIKVGDKWDGDVQELESVEFKDEKKVKIKSKFRKYNSPFECFCDQGLILKRNWLKAFVHHDPVDFISSIQNSERKYSADSNYVEKIHKIIKNILENKK